MLEAILFLLVLFELKEPTPPQPVCIGGKVWLLYPTVVQPLWKECTDEPCIVYPPKRKKVR